MNAPLQPNMHFHKVELKPKDYKNETTAFWCAGCGHYGVLTGLLRALSEIGVDPNYLVNVSCIGSCTVCSTPTINQPRSTACSRACRRSSAKEARNSR